MKKSIFTIAAVISAASFIAHAQMAQIPEPALPTWVSQVGTQVERIACDHLSITEESYDRIGEIATNTPNLWVYRKNGTKVMQIELTTVDGVQKWSRQVRNTYNGDWSYFETNGSVYAMDSQNAAQYYASQARYFAEIGATFETHAQCQWHIQ